AATYSSDFKIGQLWDGLLYSPVEKTINRGVDWIGDNLKPVFDILRLPIEGVLNVVSTALNWCPSLLLVTLLALLSWKFVGKIFTIAMVAALLVLIVLGVWNETMQTLSLVLTSLIFCVLLGLPLGVLVAASDRLNRLVRPLLDIMQTTPSFVYLVPIVILLGTGAASGTIVTIIFALPPLVRMTNLGIRQVRPDLIEAAKAYGASPWQMLVKVQMPLALPSVMAGINQSLMLALSMVVVAAMISVPGLGQMVYESLGSLNMGKAVIGGAGIVILAIILDRLTQALSKSQSEHKG
ncbi:MAG: ABC transporter permease, partial [Saezia sp.]